MYSNCWLYTTAIIASISMSNAQMSNWDTEFDHVIALSNEIKLYWTNLANDITEFGLECQTSGWCAIGLSPDGNMINSDIMLGWFDENNNNTAIVQNRKVGSIKTTPMLSTDQDLIKNITGQQVNGITKLRFSRPKYPCNNEDLNFPKGTSRIIFAWHTSDPNPEPLIHSTSNRGVKSINLDTGIGFEEALPNDVLSINLTVNNYTVANSDTTYYCSLHKLPNTTLKQHIVRFEPIITPGNEAVVHHMLVYACPISSVNETHVGQGWTCDAMPSMDNCRGGALTWGWAIGGHAFNFPSHVGLPMSGWSSLTADTLQYVLIETHYDNPTLSSNIIDSSGISIYYTPTQRSNEAGILRTGIEVYPTHFIPPGITSTTNYGYCPSECTSATLPQNGINVFASLLHGHVYTTGLSARHIRDGVELPIIDINENYDFNYQNTIPLVNETVILPGDKLVTVCNYSTTTASEYVKGGIATTDEMCLAFFYVYPKPDLVQCDTLHSTSVFMKWMIEAALNGYVGGDTGVLSTGSYSGLTWANTSDALAFYEKLWTDPAYENRTVGCQLRNGSNAYTNDAYQPLQPYTEWQAPEICLNEDTVLSPSPNSESAGYWNCPLDVSQIWIFGLAIIGLHL